MANLIRGICSGWIVAVGIVLSLDTVHAAASPTNSCPAGQVAKWTARTGWNYAGCPSGTVINGAEPTAQIIAACRQPHGATGPTSNTHWADSGWTVDYTQVGAGGQAASVRGASHTSAHGVYGDASQIMILDRSCVAATCTSPAGTDLGFQTVASHDAGVTVACIDHCRAETAFVFSINPSMGQGGEGTRWNSTGQTCNAEPDATALNDLCVNTESATACASKNNPQMVSDGKLDKPETPDPSDFDWSGTGATDLQNEGCVVLQSGAAFCIVSAPNDKKPDNGNAGQPATPTADVTYNAPYGGNTTYNYYNSSIVNSSTNYGDGTGNGECNPATTNCNGVGDPNGECDPATDENCREDGKGTIDGGNTCSAPPVCNNDPIQCYHATRLWEMKCAFATPSSSSLTAAVDAGITDGFGLGPGQSLVPQVGDDVDLSAWWQPQSASTDCPSDITITLWLTTVTIPVSQWCGLLRAAGLFVLIAAALNALRIFAKGVE